MHQSHNEQRNGRSVLVITFPGDDDDDEYIRPCSGRAQNESVAENSIIQFQTQGPTQRVVVVPKEVAMNVKKIDGQHWRRKTTT